MNSLGTYDPFNNPDAPMQALESMTSLQKIVILYPIRFGGIELSSESIRGWARNESLREGLSALITRGGVRRREAKIAMEKFFSRYEVEQPATVSLMVAKVEEIFREKILPESLSFDEAYAEFERCLKTNGSELELKKYAGEWRTSQNQLVGNLAKRLYEIRLGRGEVETGLISQTHYPANIIAAHHYMNGLIFLRESKIDQAEASFLSICTIKGASRTLCDLAAIEHIIGCSENKFERAWENFTKHKLSRSMAFSIRRAWSGASDANLVRFSQMMGLLAEDYPSLTLYEKASGIIQDPETQVSMKCWLLVKLALRLRIENYATASLLIDSALEFDGLSELSLASATYVKALLITDKLKKKKDEISVEEVREILQLLFLVRSHSDFFNSRKTLVYLTTLECMTLNSGFYLESTQNGELLSLLPDDLKTEEGRVAFLHSLFHDQARLPVERKVAAVALMLIFMATNQHEKLMLHCTDMLKSTFIEKEIRLRAFNELFSKSKFLVQIDNAILLLGKEAPRESIRQLAIRIEEEAEKRSSSEKESLLIRALFYYEKLFPANWRQQGLLAERPGDISFFIDYLRATKRAGIELPIDKMTVFIKLLGEAFYTNNERREEFCKALLSCSMRPFLKLNLLELLVATKQNEWAVLALNELFPVDLSLTSTGSLLDYCRAQVKDSNGRKKAVLQFYIARMLHESRGHEKEEMEYYDLALASSEISDAEKVEIEKMMPKRRASPSASTSRRKRSRLDP